MNIIELHREFSKNYPYVFQQKNSSEILWGQIDNIIAEKAHQENPGVPFFLLQT